mmetsp:Transcript_7426/g.24596  ORF Transcript_7426/g.24596 Transcript_7426/m.24596 type:complete len:284 (+) Transcript_7426:4018-4869(+)
MVAITTVVVVTGIIDIDSNDTFTIVLCGGGGGKIPRSKSHQNFHLSPFVLLLRIISLIIIHFFVFVSRILHCRVWIIFTSFRVKINLLPALELDEDNRSACPREPTTNERSRAGAPGTADTTAAAASIHRHQTLVFDLFHELNPLHDGIVEKRIRSSFWGSVSRRRGKIRILFFVDENPPPPSFLSIDFNRIDFHQIFLRVKQERFYPIPPPFSRRFRFRRLNNLRLIVIFSSVRVIARRRDAHQRLPSHPRSFRVDCFKIIIRRVSIHDVQCERLLAYFRDQ